MSHPTPISKALTNSIHGRCHVIYDLGKIILAKMYPSVIHLIVSLRYYDRIVKCFISEHDELFIDLPAVSSYNDPLFLCDLARAPNIT